MEKRRDRKSKSLKSKDSGKTVYIGNLSYKRNEKGIEWLFSPYGRVKSVELITKPGSDESKGYAFVKMLSSEEALEAINNLNGRVVDGRTLKVSEALERQETTPVKAVKAVKNRAEIEESEIQQPKKKSGKKKQGLNALFDYLNKR